MTARSLFRRWRRQAGRHALWPARLLLALAPALLSPLVVEAATHDGVLCTRAIRGAERIYGLPEGLLLAVALTETGRHIDEALTPWPWSVNAGGEGLWFAERPAAIDHARRLRAGGIESIDVGCMQVNLLWHEAAFADLEAAFEPRANVEYAARHIAELRAKSRDWLEAAGRYHSWDAGRARVYLERLRANWAAVLDDARGAMVTLPVAPGRMALRFVLPPAGDGGPFAAFPGAWPSDWSTQADGRPLLVPAPSPLPVGRRP